VVSGIRSRPVSSVMNADGLYVLGRAKKLPTAVGSLFSGLFADASAGSGLSGWPGGCPGGPGGVRGDGEEGAREHGQGDVPVPGAVAADLVAVQAGLRLRWPRSARPGRSCPPRTGSPPRSRTCLPCGQMRPPATGTASGCCAPCSPTSLSPPTPKILVGLRWKSGASQQIPATRRKNAIQLRSTDPAAIALARQVGPHVDNTALAAALNDAGHRTGTGQPFDATAAANLRNYHRVPYPGLLKDGELTRGRSPGASA
jgi:hypothetical protein